jgi:hypothetical protein
VKQHTTLTQLRIAQRERFKDIMGDIHAVHKMMATDGKEDFVELTSGTVSSKTLRAMRNRAKFNSFLTRKGVLAPLPINKQTGKLHAAITLSGPHGPKLAYDLFSNVRDGRQYVLKPEGTSKMVGRGLLGKTGRLRARHRARSAAYVDVLRAKLKARA